MKVVPPNPNSKALAALYRWFDINIFALGREMRLSYLPPLMVYVAAGISSLTGIVGTFYVKDRLGLSGEFLAALAFWIWWYNLHSDYPVSSDLFLRKYGFRH